jgi:hypothetical protein
MSKHWPQSLLPLRKTVTPRLWSSLSHRRKLQIRDMMLSGELSAHLATNGKHYFIDWRDS